jgi:hypothetical protein
MKISTFIFLCSLICFTTCSKTIFSNSLRSSNSIDLNSYDQALVQTENKNKIRSLAYARQNVQVAQAAKPAVPQPNKSNKKEEIKSGQKPEVKNTKKADDKAVQNLYLKAAKKNDAKPAQTSGVKPTKKADAKPANSNNYGMQFKSVENKVENNKSEAPKSAEANKQTTSEIKVKSVQGVVAKRTTSGSSFITISTTVLAVLFALF